MKKIFLLYLLLCGCASHGMREIPGPVAEIAGMKRVEVSVDGFALTTFQRMTGPDAPVRIYIEGDGFAWIMRAQPSADPTPRHAIALSLAIADRSSNVVYLARPCQYSLAQSPRCEAAYWTDKRFSEEIIQAMNHAVDVIMLAAPRQKIDLVGYSGGGAVAVLLAARRNDVASLRTVAGNLDHAMVNRHHHVSPMPDSLDPADVAYRLASVPQLHFYGDKDDVIPGFVAQSFAKRVGDNGCLDVVAVKGATHGEGWEEAWPSLLGYPVRCEKQPAKTE